MAYLEPFGYRDIATKAPMTDDTIFAIASMTKPITCVALMTLVEQGKVALSDPLAKYLPEWKDVRVLGEAKDDKPGELATLPSTRRDHGPRPAHAYLGDRLRRGSSRPTLGWGKLMRRWACRIEL